ncbi:MAG TPA: lamin tail domain-containing protein [Anaerolineales bacterium]|nr:lamin tail domain-containing protein [Anaerolineales bacterium]
MKRNALNLFAIALSLAVVVSLLPGQLLKAQAVSANIVISQVYGGGGGSGYYKYDYVELFNLGAAPVDISGWSLQYGSSTGNFGSSGSNIYAFPAGTALQPGKYLFVQLGSAGTAGIAFPVTPDLTTGNLNLAQASGKVALANVTTALGCGATATPCTLPDSRIVDSVSFGAANNGEGGTTVNNGVGLTNQQGGIRKQSGCQDTDNNNADFDVATGSALVMRNSVSPAHFCSGPTNPSGIGAASPATLFAGDPTLLTVAVTPGANPVSTGLAVTCDLSAIGGSASQAFFDDGTNGDGTAGDNTFSFATTVAGSTTGGSKSLACSITDGQARTGSAAIGLGVTVILPIGTVNGAVQNTDDGAAHTSPFVGQSVTIKGVIYEKTLQAITGSTNSYKGFFIQNTAATADTDQNTSDGLFVFMNTATTLSGPGGPYTPAVGDEIILTGKVSEYYNMTELVSPFQVVSIARSGVDIEAEVPPVVANPPVSLADANRYWERLQGMRVQVPQDSLVLGGRNVFSPADAEIWVTRPDSTVAARSNPYAQRAFRDAHPLDDNYDPANWDGNGYRILMGSLGIKALAGDAQALIAPARTFDTLTNAPAGGVNYTFSKYRIEITAQPEFNEGPDPAANNPPQAFDRSVAYSIADYNLENLYDYRDNPFSGCDFPGNSGCPLVAPFIAAVTPPYDYVPASDADYQARLNDIALEINNDLHSPDILMVQEVENQDICTVTDGALTCGTTDNADGKPDVLQELALKIASLGGPAYDAAFDRNSSDLRGIAPSFLYRTDRVELLPPAGDPILGSSPAIPGFTAVPYDSDVSNPKTLNAVLPAGVTACETNWVFPRAPDIALFRIYSSSIGVGSHRDVYVIDNHFKSGPDTCVGHRTEQAMYNAALVAFLQAANPNARIVLGGDLNVYTRPDDPFAPIGQPGSSDQLAALYDPSLGLKNLWEVLLAQAPESAYSYVYLGMAQTIDQMYVNQPMLADLQQYRFAHINSDFPADYSGDVARGTSDHDPNVAVFGINDPPVVDAGGPYTVDEGSSLTVSATGSDPEGGPLTYAWDLDNNGTFETPGQSVVFTAPDGPITQTINVQAKDSGGLTTVASTTVTVNNLPPTASLGNNGPVAEGGLVTITFTGPADPSAVDLAAGLHYAVSCDGSSLSAVTYATSNTSPSTGCLFDDGPATQTVRGRVIDKDDGYTEYTTVVTVTNVAPTATFTAPSTLNEGDAFTVALTGALDPSQADKAAGFQYAFDCGFGYSAFGMAASASCSALDNPGLTVRGKIMDKDGGMSEYSAAVAINNVAPSLGPITAPTSPVPVNSPVNASASFTDPGVLDTHTAVWNWGDGSSSAGTVSESNGSGAAAGSHTYHGAGLYVLTLTVKDKDGGSSQATFSSVIVYNPNGGSATGDGWINSPAGAYLANPTLKGKAFFDFDVRYKKGATTPDGNVNFRLQSAALDFRSTGLDWMIVDRDNSFLCWFLRRCSSDVTIKGQGTLKTGGTVQFMIWASDDHPDTFRIKIWSVGAGGAENVIYDNRSEQTLGGGIIVVRR